MTSKIPSTAEYCKLAERKYFLFQWSLTKSFGRKNIGASMSEHAILFQTETWQVSKSAPAVQLYMPLPFGSWGCWVALGASDVIGANYENVLKLPKSSGGSESAPPTPRRPRSAPEGLQSFTIVIPANRFDPFCATCSRSLTETSSF
jgi:hypothetical protein